MSHLSVLINRVVNELRSIGKVRKDTLINLAEYMTYWDDYTEEEARQARAILKEFHLEKLIGNQDLINRELEKEYHYRCGRCGRALSNPISVKYGYGPVCRKKLGITVLERLEKNLQKLRERKVGKVITLDRWI